MSMILSSYKFHTLITT